LFGSKSWFLHCCLKISSCCYIKGKRRSALAKSSMLVMESQCQFIEAFIIVSLFGLANWIDIVDIVNCSFTRRWPGLFLIFSTETSNYPRSPLRESSTSVVSPEQSFKIVSISVYLFLVGISCTSWVNGCAFFEVVELLIAIPLVYC